MTFDYKSNATVLNELLQFYNYKLKKVPGKVL